MKSLKVLSAILFIFICFQNIFAEEYYSVSGNIIDSETNTSLHLAEVRMEELSISTTSNTKGEFEFNTIPPGNYHFIVSLTGYKSNTFLIYINANTTNLEFKLEKTLIETPTIDVTSSFTPTEIKNSTFSLSTISLRELTKHRGEILASTIENIPGINNISTGISLGKPVIRGLTSLGVIIVHDGVKHESQQWGDEHAPEVSLYDLDRIEILRGPASLVYGSDAIGGVINIISKPLQFSSGKKSILYGGFDAAGYSVNEQKTGNLTLGYGLSNWGVKGHLGYRSNNDTKTPDGVLITNSINPDIKDTITGGLLSNSGAKELEGGVSFGTIGKYGQIVAGFELFNRDIQMHDIDPLSTANQKIRTKQFELSGEFSLNKKLILEPVISYQIQSRKEFETNTDKDEDNASLNLEMKNFQSDLRLQHILTKDISGTIGASLTSTINETLGIEKLIPNYNSSAIGFYVSEKMQKKYFSVSIGGRFDTKNLNVENTVFETDSLGNTLKSVSDRNLKFNAFTGSLGIVTHPVSNIDLFANLGRGWRAPSEFELFVDGEHEGTGRNEKGLITLDSTSNPNPESSWNIDLGLRANFKKINASLSFFNNIINDFIYPAPTGIFDSTAMLPVYNLRQAKGVFWGFEYSLQIQPVNFILLSLTGDYVTAKNDATGNYLPLIPPAKNIIEVKFQERQFGNSIYNPYFSFSTKIVSAQNQVNPLETSTDGYVLLKTGIGFDFVLSKSIASMDFSIDNLADTKYVDHLSRYKTYAMNPGRSFNLKLSAPFNF
ncbi:MAG: TonB-dependent receptor [Bacteroidetes bacterium]|nr:TonB-dependent receptor [Bacteroidota bacterium]